MKLSPLLACFLLAQPIAVGAETLRILNWEEYLHPKVIEMWEAESGVTVEQTYFDSDEDRDELLNEATQSGIDIAVVDEAVSELFGARGKIERLDRSTVPNLEHVDPSWRSACGEYTTPYLWGTLGIAYRSDKVNKAPQSWHDLLEPEEAFKGHIGMLDDYRDMLAPALFVLGHSLNTGDENELRAAFTYLERQAPSVLTYDYAITVMKDRGDVADRLYMALVYGGDQYTLNDIVGQPGLWQYRVPREGTILWVDCLAVIADSPRKALALEFVDFLNRPEIAAINAEFLGYGTPNHSAITHMTQAYQNDPSVFPSQDILRRSQQYKVLGKDNIILRKRITGAVRKVHESQ